MAKRRRIFIEATPLISERMSGVGNVLLETVRALDQSEYAVQYAVKLFVPWDERIHMDRYKFRHVKIVRIPLPHKVMSLLSRMRIGLPIDLLLGKGDYIFPNFRNWTLLFSKSYTYIHDVSFMIYPQYVESRNLKFLTKYMKIWIKRANKIITISNSSKREIEKYLHVQNKQISVVPNAVDTNIFYRRSKEEVTSIKKKYGLTGRYFLYLGNIEPRKNLQTLIDAFVMANIENAELFLVGGDGWLNDGIFKKIEEATAAGYSVYKNRSYVPDSDIPALMSGAVALVQPSWHEGFGLATVQALACGTLNVCSDISALREATTGNEHAVIFFDPQNVEELSIALHRAYKTHTTVASRVSTWNESAAKLINIIKEQHE